jgi:DNA repair protein RadC
MKQTSKHIQKVTLYMKKDKYITIAEEGIYDKYSASKIFQNLLSTKDREVFAIICMDIKGEPICYSEVHIGTLNQSLIHPREVFKVALLCNAHSLIVAHNHPSGNSTPSNQDIEITKILKKAGEALGISVIDHLIVTDDDVLSLNSYK